MFPREDQIFGDSVTIHSLVLEQIDFRRKFILGGHARDKLRLSDITDLHPMINIVREQVMELQTSILAEKLAHDVVPVYFSYPTTWYDAFKKRFFPKWFLGKFPPRYTLVTKYVDFKQHALYPMINTIYPDYPKEEIIIKSTHLIR